MTGIAELVSAAVGGGRAEDLAYAQMANRIVDAQSKRALLDQRVAEAAKAKDIMRSRGNFERNSMDLPAAVRFAILSDMADQYKYGQEAMGVEQINSARGQAIDVAEQLRASGADPIDIING